MTQGNESGYVQWPEGDFRLKVKSSSTPGSGKDLLPVLWFRNPVSHSSFWVNEGAEAVSGAGLAIPADAYL